MTYRKVEQATQAQGGDVVEWWADCFQKEWLEYHWMVPYPDGNGSMISTVKKTGKRQWFSIHRKGDMWVWAKAGHQKGRPAAYPSTLTMSLDELTDYLDGLRRQRGSELTGIWRLTRRRSTTDKKKRKGIRHH